SARGAAVQGSLLQPDGSHDLSLQADHGRHPGAAGRNLFVGRRCQRRARLLCDQRRHGQALPAALPAALFPDLFHLPPVDQWWIALRLHRVPGRTERHRGRARTMSQPIARQETRPSPHPTETRPYKQSFYEKTYLPLFGGMLVTIRHFLRNLLGRGKMYTIQYPEERRNYSHRFRGHHILTTRPDGSVRCVACYLCAQNCPAECIHIEAGEHPDVNIEKYPVVYEIDMLRCIFC